MKEFTEEQKQSMWTRLGSLLGLSTETPKVKLAEYQTQDGVKISVNDETQETDAEDGEYPLADGKILVVKDGKAEVKEAPEPEVESVETAEEEVVTPEVEDTKVEDLEKENEALKAEVESLKATIETLTKEKEESTKEATELKVQLSEIESKPADKKLVLGAQKEATGKKMTVAERAAAMYS